MGGGIGIGDDGGFKRLKEVSDGIRTMESPNLKEIGAQVQERLREQQNKQIKPEDLIEETGISCKIPGCKGIIVREYYIPYIPAQPGGENIMGPGSENIATIRNKKLKSIYCNCCMVKYEKVPQ